MDLVNLLFLDHSFRPQLLLVHNVSILVLVNPLQATRWNVHTTRTYPHYARNYVKNALPPQLKSLQIMDFLHERSLLPSVNS